jgi:hypothetical protein
MYNDIVTREGLPFDTSSWKVKVPFKIKNFLWYLRKGVVLAKDNLAKRNWKGGSECCVVVNMRQFYTFFLLPDSYASLGHGQYNF